MTQEDTNQQQRQSPWATSAVTFAATMMVLLGVFQAIEGLAAIIDDQYFVVARGYAFNLDTSTWGWIHLILGLAMLAAGIGLFYRTVWAGVATLFLAVLSAVNNFFFIPYQPVWSLLVIGLNVWVIWALTRPRMIRT
ncbi:hypothetical protein AB0E63_07850 [Kribbella sp. NPDC026596]|uniref:DUF7144 family membrane protein n=1 Tax=Kribbella sp. NPDC026596 TaxID=3155122 RepID=UPI0034053310